MKKIDVDGLWVYLLSTNENVVGVDVTDEERVFDGNQSFTKIENPKRLYRLMQQSSHGFVVNYMVGDWDFIESGYMYIQPVAKYKVSSMDVRGQIDFLKLFEEYFARKTAARAIEAGLVTPTSGILRPTAR